MHVIPRRCKLLLKPYFLFGKKRQNKIAPIIGVRLTLTIKNIYIHICSVYKALGRYSRGGERTSVVFFEKVRMSERFLIYLDAECGDSVASLTLCFCATGMRPRPRYEHRLL